MDASRKLTPEAYADRIEFECDVEDHGCTCHISAPCTYCTHPGNPANQEEDENCWVQAFEPIPLTDEEWTEFAAKHDAINNAEKVFSLAYKNHVEITEKLQAEFRELWRELGKKHGLQLDKFNYSLEEIDGVRHIVKKERKDDDN